MYAPEERAEIATMLSGNRRLAPEEIDLVRRELRGKTIPHTMGPFIGLLATNPALYRKLSEDERVATYSLFGFFPETYDLVYGNKALPDISFARGNRGIIGMLRHPEKSRVIKPQQSSKEREIARIADELEIGPRQYTSLDNFLTEEFVDGTPFSQLRGEQSSPDKMYTLGKRVGEILHKLHGRNIYYNDTILTDDMGRSHVLVPADSPAILFDYGVAINLDQHPNLDDEDVFNYARTLPEINMALAMQLEVSDAQRQDIIRRYRPQLEKTPKEGIMTRDIDFIQEGLSFAIHRIGDHCIDPFVQGFRQEYKA